MTGDFDGDGDLDLAAVGPSLDEVVWLEDTGSGFTRHLVTSTLNEPVDLAPGDIDCDGDLDLVIAVLGTDSVVWYRNDGGASSWSLGATISSAAPDVSSIAVADINGDGDLDVFGALPGNDQIVRWRNQGCPGTSWNSATVSSGQGEWVSVAAGDIDGDGRPDVAAASITQDSVAYWPNTGAGVWSMSMIDGTFNGAAAVALGDVDGDGDQDVLIGETDSNGFTLCRNGGAGPPWSCGRVVTGTAELDGAGLGDLDRDGDLDVAVAAEPTAGALPDALWLEVSAGATSWTLHTVDATVPGLSEMRPVDLDGDGDLDLASDTSTWWRNGGGTPLAWTAESIPGSVVFDAAWGDLDGDGDPDLAAAAVAGFSVLGLPVLAWFENDLGGPSGSWLEHDVRGAEVFASFEDVALADLDLDGDLDLVAGLVVQGQRGVSWFENDLAASSGLWAEHPIPAPFALPVQGFRLLIGDLDRDGDPDLLAGREEADFASWLNGGGQFALQTTAVAPPSIVEGSEEAVLRIEAFHRGRAGEAAMELASLDLLFEEAEGDPLDEQELGEVVAAVSVWRDDGSGAFDSALDAEVASFTTLSQTDGGVVVLALADGVAGLQHLPADTPATYFVTLELSPAAAAAGIPSLTVTHVQGDGGHPQGDGSAAENADFDTSLLREAALPVAATFEVLAGLADEEIFADGFESGDTSAWSLVVP